MNNWTTYIYLFFLEECNGFNPHFHKKIFQFHRFLTLEKQTKWERLFWVNEQGDFAKDVETDNALRTLIHHGLVHANYEVNEAGNQWLEKMNQRNQDVYPLLQEFLKKEASGEFKIADCFLKGYSYPAACHLCQERVCVNTQLTMKDFGRLLNFKGIKNPYKKRMFEPPPF